MIMMVEGTMLLSTASRGAHPTLIYYHTRLYAVSGYPCVSRTESALMHSRCLPYENISSVVNSAIVATSAL